MILGVDPAGDGQAAVVALQQADGYITIVDEASNITEADWANVLKHRLWSKYVLLLRPHKRMHTRFHRKGWRRYR